MSKESYNKIFKKEIEYLGNNFLGEVKNVSIFIGTYSFLVNFMIFDDVTEFVENGLEEIILGKPFQDLSGIQIDTLNGVVWLSNSNDVTIFKMPRVVENFKHWNRK
jgi:chemotaxis regulatin CheY-phosphate phosphatase CheZ